MNTVDVVIPNYNYAHFLSQCVASVLNQEQVEVRVLIIDDCSIDDTKRIGDSWAERDSRVVYRRHATNKGHIRTFNEGVLDWASSKYTVLISADDALAPGALARATDLMEQHPEVGLTYGMARIVGDEDTRLIQNLLASDEYRVIESARFLERCFAKGNAIPTPTAVVRTELQHRIGGYRDDMPHTSDLEMWMRFAANAPVGVVRSIQAFYRKHYDNMSARYHNRLLGDRREVMATCDHFLSEWGRRFPEADRWRGLMLKRMSEESCWIAYHALEAGQRDDYLSCKRFATHLYPEIRRSPVWRRLRVKRMLGAKLYGGLSFMKRLFRGGSADAGGQTVGSQETNLSGWWPDGSEVRV